MFARTALTALVLFAYTVIDQPRCFGQAFSANLTGLVTDPAGAAVPGISIKVLNTATREEVSLRQGCVKGDIDGGIGGFIGARPDDPCAWCTWQGWNPCRLRRHSRTCG
jgi:hypothetical protein